MLCAMLMIFCVIILRTSSAVSSANFGSILNLRNLRCWYSLTCSILCGYVFSRVEWEREVGPFIFFFLCACMQYLYILLFSTIIIITID